MIVTTTFSIEGKPIIDYKGIAFGETISGVNLFKDMSASLRDVFGGRSKAYESALMEARNNAIKEMCDDARQKGANAVVGVSISYEALGEGGHGMLMVTASGTAVVVQGLPEITTQVETTTPTEEPKPTVVIDRTQEYIRCPKCGRKQASSRDDCFACGIAFVEKTNDDSKQHSSAYNEAMKQIEERDL